MLRLYSIGLSFYQFGIKIASLFNRKAKAWVAGRQHIFNNLKEKLAGDTSPKIWFHCSSFGEFEQGLPVLQQIKKDYPAYAIVLTFFSPSGYKQGFKEPAADYVFYLPMDGRSNAHAFLKIVDPKLAIFVKYDFWFFYMISLFRKKIPFVYISSVFRDDQYFFKWFGKTFLDKLKLASHFFVQDEFSQKLLFSKGIKNVSVSGDTRFDRVAQLPALKFTDEKIAAFTKNSRVIIGGSTWPEDEELLLRYMDECTQKIKLIIVPHEINETAIKKTIQQNSGKAMRYSQSATDEFADATILIIDTVGMLSKIYRLGHIAFIGGGFGKGIHNILEAAVYGLPVLFGPTYFKFNEAKKIIQLQGAWTVKNYTELKKQLDLLSQDDDARKAAGKINQLYISEQGGATQKIMLGIRPFLT